MFLISLHFKKHLIHLHRDTGSTNTMDNVGTQRERDEPSSSQAFCTDTPVTTQVTVDKPHVLNMCGSVEAQLLLLRELSKQC